MLIRFEDEVINLNNIVHFYHAYKSKEYEKPYLIRFVTISDTYATFDFKTEQERKAAFELIITYWKEGFNYYEI